MHDQLRARMKMRELTQDDVVPFNELLRYAFQVTNQELTEVGWDGDEDIRQSKSPILARAFVLGWFDGEKLASQIAVYPMIVNIYGKLLPMGGVTGVATYPEYSGIGLMHELMIRALGDMRRRGQTVSFLFPYDIPFYRHKGWEVVSDEMTFKLTDEQLPKAVDVPGMVERVSQDHADLHAVHRDYSRITHGALVRDALAWEEYWRWDVEDEIVAIYYTQAHQPTGYLVYTLANEHMTVKEMVYLNPEARQGLWNYISAHYSMITEVKVTHYTGISQSFLFEDSDIVETLQPYMMARIVDVDAFLRLFPFRATSHPIALSFEVTDPLVAENRGIFSVTGGSGTPWTIGRDLLDHRVQLNIQTLTAMFLGYKRSTYLHSVGRLDADDEALAMLESMLPVGKVCFSDYF